MVMASTELMPEPESPLDVLSRAASMVESGASESESEVSPPRQEAGLGSRKEVHPKFRKHSAAPSTPPPPAYSHSVATTSSSPEEAPLDFSIRKRSLSPSGGGGGGGGPPFKYSNPLRQHSPPASSHHLPVTPAPSYFRPPPYPRTPSPPPPPPPSDRRPPPPSYEAAMASKPVSPRVAVSTTSPTFMTLTTRPSPTTKAGSEYSVSLMTSSPTNKTDSHSRPSVICTGPSAVKKEEEKEGLPVVNLFKKEENKENKESSAESESSRKREVTIVEESGAGDLMEEHFRKSLGEDYSKVFKESEKKKVEEESSPSEEMEVDPVKAFKEDLDMSGYTVEDHFAKALGDTWVKLQAEAEKKDKKPSSVSHKESAAQLLAL